MYCSFYLNNCLKYFVILSILLKRHMHDNESDYFTYFYVCLNLWHHSASKFKYSWALKKKKYLLFCLIQHNNNLFIRCIFSNSSPSTWRMNDITSFSVKSIAYPHMCLKYAQNGQSGTFKNSTVFCSNFTMLIRSLFFKKYCPVKMLVLLLKQWVIHNHKSCVLSD